MKKYFRFLLLTIFTCLIFGQLTRITLSSQIAFYFHDFLILIFLFSFFLYQFFYYCFHQRFTLTSSFFQTLLSKIKTLPRRRRQALSFLIFGACLFLFASAATSLLAFLYFLRFFAYFLFIFSVASLTLFTQSEWQKIWLTFFFSLAICGLFQYFFFPDTRFLENLGWDDHYYRLIGTWFDPVFTALGLVFGLLYLFFFSPVTKHSSWRLVLFFSILGSALIFTYSRSAFLALFLALVFYFFQHFVLQKNNDQLKSLIKKLSAKKTLFLVSSILVFAFVFFVFSARLHPSDSTNLLRTNSISLRWQTFISQAQSFSWRTWILGDGFFVPHSSVKDSLNFSPFTQNIAVAKKTAPFPDNLFLLLISFFGVPMTLIFTVFIFRFCCFCWRYVPPLFYFLLVLLVVAQFNQTVFQPFIFLTFGLLLSSGIFSLSRVKSLKTN